MTALVIPLANTTRSIAPDNSCR